MKFQGEKITSGWDITKNVEGGRIPPPGSFRVKYDFDTIYVHPLFFSFEFLYFHSVIWFIFTFTSGYDRSHSEFDKQQ